MKRSRIFLGVTTTLLAVAGIAAAKAHRIPARAVYYYTKVVNGHTYCTKPLVTHCDKNGLGAACEYQGRFLYTKFNSCSTISRYNTQ